jgi:hypothetical protein
MRPNKRMRPAALSNAFLGPTLLKPEVLGTTSLYRYQKDANRALWAASAWFCDVLGIELLGHGGTPRRREGG